jgi:hypothetical protein
MTTSPNITIRSAKASQAVSGGVLPRVTASKFVPVIGTNLLAESGPSGGYNRATVALPCGRQTGGSAVFDVALGFGHTFDYDRASVG